MVAEEGQVELQEAVRSRNKKERDRDRDRELLMSNRNKRRRGSKREEEEDSTEESVGDEEEEEEYDAAAADDNSHRRNFPPKRTARHWKVGDEMIGVSFPRKARSGIIQISLKPLNVSVSVYNFVFDFFFLLFLFIFIFNNSQPRRKEHMKISFPQMALEKSRWARVRLPLRMSQLGRRL